MKLLNLIAAWSCLCVQVYSTPGSFYYSAAPAPIPYYQLQQQFPTTSYHGPTTTYHGRQAFQPYTVAAPPTYNEWQPQTYYSAPAIRYQQPIYTQQVTQRRTPVNVQAAPARFATQPSDNYRGFAYHTRYNDGASSHVVFLTGPEASQVQINMPKLESRMTITARSKNLTGVEIAKTAASDAVDSIASKNVVFPQLPRNSAFDALRNFLENDDEGYQNYYSNNGILEARNFGQYSNFPASSTPLRTSDNSISSRSGGDIEIIETATKKEEKIQEVEEAAESINTNTRFMPNIIVVEDEEDSKSEEMVSFSTTTTPTTTPAPTTTAPTTTTDPTTTTTTAPTTTESAPTTSATTATTTQVAATTVTASTTSTMQPIIVEDMTFVAESRSITTEAVGSTTDISTPASMESADSTTTENSTPESVESTTSSIETTTQ